METDSYRTLPSEAEEESQRPVSTLPIRNGNIALNIRRHQSFHLVVSTLPIRNGNHHPFTISSE